MVARITTKNDIIRAIYTLSLSTLYKTIGLVIKYQKKIGEKEDKMITTSSKKKVTLISNLDVAPKMVTLNIKLA
jgi:hypothetical protein